jgi:hypothetical protein
MDLTADALTRVLAVCCGAEPEGPEEAVLMVRREQPSIAATLYAAWRNEGSPLNVALRYELDVQAQRIHRYRALAADLAVRVPGVVPLKGLEVADLYPADSLRYMNDLDYACDDEPQLWWLVAELVDDGWDLHTATFWRLGGVVHMLVSLRMPHEDRYCLPYGVEVASYVTMGDLAGVRPVIELPPAWRDPMVKNLLMLLFERFEQPYRARDLVDAALLLERQRDYPLLWDEIDRIGLWPEYTELTALLARTELVEIPSPDRPIALALARSRARRAGRRMAGLRRPAGAVVQHLQQRLVFSRQSRLERLLWSAAERRLPPDRALRSGLLCFGLPLPDVRPDVSRATVRQRDGLVFVDTPVGRFLLTAGDDVEEEAVRQLTADARSARPAPAEPAMDVVDPLDPDPVDPDPMGPDPIDPMDMDTVDTAAPAVAPGR